MQNDLLLLKKDGVLLPESLKDVEHYLQLLKIGYIFHEITGDIK